MPRYLDHGNLTSKQQSGEDDRVCKVPKSSLKTNAFKDGYARLIRTASIKAFVNSTQLNVLMFALD